jgi:molybdate transport system substrate-binding protein
VRAANFATKTRRAQLVAQYYDPDSPLASGVMNGAANWRRELHCCKRGKKRYISPDIAIRDPSMVLNFTNARAVAVCLAAVFLAAPARAEMVTVFAAASLQEVMGEVAAQQRNASSQGQKRSNQQVRLVFAATSTLARQIARGAPADVFVAAHPRWMRWLAAQPHLRLGRITTILSNRLALVTRAQVGAARPVAFGSVDLAARLDGGRLALGDPAHVPVGLYARAALQKLGLWQQLRGRLAQTANTRAAVALVARGEAPLGIVYRSDAAAERRLRIVALVPPAHPPIRYQAALVGAKPSAAARVFFERLVRAAAAGRFARLGFDLPKARR